MDNDFINEYGFIVISAIIGIIVVGFIVTAVKYGGLFASLIQEHDIAVGG